MDTTPTTVREAMTPSPVTVQPDTLLEDAQRLMKKHGFRRLPVMRRGRVVGIVTDRDIKEAMPSAATTLSIWEVMYQLGRLKVSEVMTFAPLTIPPHVPLEDAAHLMLERRIGGLPVVDDAGKLVGVVTATDVLRAFTTQPELA